MGVLPHGGTDRALGLQIRPGAWFTRLTSPEPMPFPTTDPFMERARLVAAHLDGLYSVTELADRFGVSRPTVYKWIARYRDGGAGALADRPRVARTQPGQTPPETEALLVACREAHPSWGPRKLLLYLARRHPDVPLPAPSTVGALLDRHGLTKKRRPRRPPKHPGSTPLVTTAPNDVWTADYKGQFRTGDGELGRAYARPYPLTVCDAHSRFVLSCHGLPSVEQYAALGQFERLFHEYGLPTAIRSDPAAAGGRAGRRSRPRPSAGSPGSRSGGSSSGSTTSGSTPAGPSRTGRTSPPASAGWDAPDAQGRHGPAARARHGPPAVPLRPLAGRVQRGPPARRARRRRPGRPLRPVATPDARRAPGAGLPRPLGRGVRPARSGTSRATGPSGSRSTRSS